MAEPTHGEILAKIAENRSSIKSLVDAIERLDHKIDENNAKDEPIREFFNDMQTVGRIGRGVRAVIGWIVVVGGTIGVLWVLIVDSVNHASK